MRNLIIAIAILCGAASTLYAAPGAVVMEQFSQDPGMQLVASFKKATIQMKLAKSEKEFREYEKTLYSELKALEEKYPDYESTPEIYEKFKEALNDLKIVVEQKMEEFEKNRSR